MMWPFLYFYGGPGCNVLLESPVVKGLQLPNVSKHDTQVRGHTVSGAHLGMLPAARLGSLRRCSSGKYKMTEMVV